MPQTSEKDFTVCNFHTHLYHFSQELSHHEAQLVQRKYVTFYWFTAKWPLFS